MRSIIVVAHDVRSTHNVGALFRTCDGIGVEKLILSGYTPYPAINLDGRLPHLASKITGQIHKTALGSENNVAWEQHDDVLELLKSLKSDGYAILALEQSPKSTSLPKYVPREKICLVLGNEVEGISQPILAEATKIIEIPMLGEKESYNVIQAAAMALYHLRFIH